MNHEDAVRTGVRTQQRIGSEKTASMPDRIRATYAGQFNFWCDASGETHPDYVEYVRVDKLKAMEAERDRWEKDAWQYFGERNCLQAEVARLRAVRAEIEANAEYRAQTGDYSMAAGLRYAMQKIDATLTEQKGPHDAE